MTKNHTVTCQTNRGELVEWEFPPNVAARKYAELVRTGRTIDTGEKIITASLYDEFGALRKGWKERFVP